MKAVRRGAIVDAADLARALGVHSRTVQRWILRGKLRGHRVGDVRSRVRVRIRDFEAFLWSNPGRGIVRMIGQSFCLKPGQRQTPSAWRGRTDRRLMR